ncbi:MAG TPA: YciI family protein [Streptosporangiaceae bacterium]|nr:YciI family protein [Streptosporangiaceae bacterium]
MRYYLYKLIPPRPSFAADMTDTEGAIMTDHIAYWTRQRDLGSAVGFGPVADPAGSWGVAIVEAETDDAAQRLRANDPAVSSGLATAEIYPMPAAVVRPHHGPPG